MRINNNIMSMNANRALGKNTSAQAKSLEKLSSGLAINRAADDAAGLSISESMRSQIADLKRSSKNAQDGISFIQTAEGALDEVSNMLVRMTELTTQMDDGVLQTNDTDNIKAEMTALSSEITDIITNTTFNGKNITATITAGIKISASLTAPSLTGTSTSAQVEAAVKSISTARANFGALQNRLESKVNNTNSTVENLSAAESRIRDTDMASEMSNYNKTSILVQAATSMLAQANSAPQSVLSLLQ